MTDRDERHREHQEREEKLKRAAETAKAHAAKVSGAAAGQPVEQERAGANEGSAHTKREGGARKGVNPGARRVP